MCHPKPNLICLNTFVSRRGLKANTFKSWKTGNSHSTLLKTHPHIFFSCCHKSIWAIIARHYVSSMSTELLYSILFHHTSYIMCICYRVASWTRSPNAYLVWSEIASAKENKKPKRKTRENSRWSDGICGVLFCLEICLLTGGFRQCANMIVLFICEGFTMFGKCAEGWWTFFWGWVNDLQRILTHIFYRSYPVGSGINFVLNNFVYFRLTQMCNQLNYKIIIYVKSQLKSGLPRVCRSRCPHSLVDACVLSLGLVLIAFRPRIIKFATIHTREIGPQGCFAYADM